jgi:hypothetical protein
MSHSRTTTRCLGLLISAGLVAVLTFADSSDGAPPKKDTRAPAPKPVAPAPPRASLLTSDLWRNAPVSPATSAEIDQLIAKELEHSKVQPAPLTTDEQFIRRVSLDLIGQLPTPADVTNFVADKDSKKRAKLIDKLLESDQFARHWARYWRDVIGAKVTDRRAFLAARNFERWMTEQLNANKSWGEITRTILTAEGGVRFDDPEKNGESFFLLSHFGGEAANDRAAETSRVFLGIQIRCCQCHDHPFDQWKQVQFHELAGYFARLRERPVREGMKTVGFELISTPRGEHEMAVKNNPNNMQVAHPRFLDGKATARELSDRERRRALADAVVDKSNYWFAGAYVNRIWGTLMGQSFYQPVDDMGPERKAVFGDVLVRLASSFRGTNYDMKALFRVVMNTQTYQRQTRLGESTDEHLHFAASYPARLRPDALWQSLVSAIGQLGGRAPEGGAKPMGPFALMRLNPLAFEFQQLFDFDPSLKPDEVEGSIAQALMLMNNPAINGKIKGNGETPLAQILKDHKEDDAALKALYQRTLARQPTAKELDKCRSYIKKIGNRAEAFEDIQWTLINSTEFQTKR